MIFLATLRVGSCIDRAWRQKNRLSGHISGVLFCRRGGVYESENPLDPDDVENLKSHPDVRLEITSIAVAGLGDTDDPEIEEREVVAVVEAETQAQANKSVQKGTGRKSKAGTGETEPVKPEDV